MKDTILRIQGQSRHPRSIENVNAEQEDPRKSAPCPQSGILRPSTLSTSLCPWQERALNLSVHANKDWLRAPRLNSKKTSISQPMSVKGPPGFWLWQGGDMRGFDLTWRGRGRRYMESHVCLRRTGVTGCDIWGITPWAWNSDDSRRKCHVALLGLLVAPLRGLGVHLEGLALFSSRLQLAWCPSQISLLMFIAATLCGFPETQNPSLGNSTLVSEKSKMIQSSQYFVPVAQLILPGMLVAGSAAQEQDIQVYSQFSVQQTCVQFGIQPVKCTGTLASVSICSLYRCQQAVLW